VDTPLPLDHWVIGIDVGGTKIAAGAVELGSGAVTLRQEQPTRAERGAAAVLEDITSMADGIARQLRREGGSQSAVGIGVPELVDPEGRIRSTHLLDWAAIPLIERLGTIAPALHRGRRARRGTGRVYIWRGP
jgi:glucokinase